jgi:hypothetical protein
MNQRENELPWPDHVSNLISNTSEVQKLIRIHQAITGGQRGRPPDLEALHKSGVVLLVACWEAYIEDLAANAFCVLLDNAASPDVFPTRVLTLASRSLRGDDDERKVWELAGDGWRSVLEAHRDNLFERYIGRLNTPRPAQVDTLFESLIGLRSLSKHWKWKGMTNKKAVAKLDELITLRGEIAHRVTASQPVQRRYVEGAVEFINRLAAISSNTVVQYIIELSGVTPWTVVMYGKTG